MAWLTGYDGWSFYVHQCVLVRPDGDPVWFGRGLDRDGALRTIYMSPEQIICYPDQYVQSSERHPMEYLSGVIRDRHWGRARIGLELDNYYFSAAAYLTLQRHLPDARFLDATGLVNWQRAVKSAQELEYMSTAARIVETMHARIIEKIEPGIRKCDLVAGAGEVASPRPSDQLTIGGETFVIQNEPERRDPERLVWTLDE
jgi:ectoine hydrolase